MIPRLQKNHKSNWILIDPQFEPNKYFNVDIFFLILYHRLFYFLRLKVNNVDSYFYFSI